jgi:phenylacetate-CoA ligase
MTEFYDDLETRDRETREKALFSALPDLVENAKNEAPGWAVHLESVDPASVTSRDALASLPVLRKSTLSELQAADPPFGGFAPKASGSYGRLLMSPGPIFEPEGRGDDPWRSARAYFAAGFRPGDIIHNCFAYHLSPGAFIMEAGARALGCAVVPAGVGNTEMQIEAIAHLRPTGYSGTPDYLKVLLDAAGEAGKNVSSITRALVSGGALFPSMRDEYRERGVAVLQCYAIAELGLVAYESEALEGMIVDEGAIIEIVTPGTGDPVADGEVGEVVVTTFNPAYPMIRLATGDLSAVLEGASPCGRTNTRIKGWMGRADQAAKMKGLFIRPEQVAEIAQRHGELGRVRLEISRDGAQDVMTLKAECGEAGDDLAQKIAETLRSVTKMKGAVELVPPGTLPNDGVIIADLREGT